MVSPFKNLTPEEYSLVLKTPVLVTILVAAADNNIEKKEKDWAEKLAQYRRFSSHPVLHDYYHEVSRDFRKTLDEVIAGIPSEHFQRNQFLSNELGKLNRIFPKLEKKFAGKLYESLLTFAKKVAEASGGFLRFSTISEEEKEWIDLKMIHSPKI